MTTIGERLEDARKKKGISIREAAEATKIRGDYLQKFEGNQFDIGLTEIYVRGFLKSYAVFLKLPADRILNDYASLGRGEARPRQPSREVYGRMDLSVASNDESSERAAPKAEQPVADAGRKAFAPRKGNLPEGLPINPAVLFKGGIAAVVLIAIILVIWGIKAALAPSATAPATKSPAAQQAVTDSSQSGPASSVVIVALNDVKIKVARQSDGVELFQDWLKRGDRRDFPNIPLYLTATALQDLQIEYKGKVYPTGYTGHTRVGFDFSTIK